MPPRIGTLSSTRYAIIVDAGSSGSRLIIYSYQDPEAERNEIATSIRNRLSYSSQKKGKSKAVVEEEIQWEIDHSLRRLVKVEKGAGGDDWMIKAEPGISSMSPGNIPQYLSPLLTHAMEHIPPSQHINTPIYILATAGMRLLEEKDRNAILSATCDTLRNNYPFQVGTANALGPCGDSVRVASGEEEGMWGWVAVNYLMDGFGHASPRNYTLPPIQTETQDSLEKNISPTLVDVHQRHPTFGFLDMGGASTQIAFSPTISELEKSNFPVDELKSVSLRMLSGQAVEWPLFVASWLGFGTNKVRERYIEARVGEWQKENERLSEAIAHTGSDIPAPASKSLFQPIEDPCLPKGLKLPPTSPSIPSFIGTGSFTQCLASLQPLLNPPTPCPKNQHCLFAGLPTPSIDFEREDQRGFIGISEYWYTAQQVLGLGGVWDWAEWEKGMAEYCKRDWGNIKDMFQKEHGLDGTAVDVSRLEMQCFKGAWISNVLHEGIGIPRTLDIPGDQTLTGEKGGDLVDEAARRAKGKGLVSKTHFQSVDTIGETAVSWTLGKMIIEASKSVKPHGHDADQSVGTHRKWSQAWTIGNGRVQQWLGLPALENRLSGYGFNLFWFYIATFAILAGLIWSALRRRVWTRSIFPTKRRKASDAAEVRDWTRSRTGSAVEEGLGMIKSQGWYSSLRFNPFVNTLSACTPNLSHTKRKPDSRRPSYGRQNSTPLYSESMELSDRLELLNPTASVSLPSTPNMSSFFIPGLAEAGSTGTLDPGELTPRASPSKSHLLGDGARSLSKKSSSSTLRMKRTPMAMTSANGDLHPTGTGWNDPPAAVFGAVETSPHLLGLKALSPLSRSSSRINLEEYGSNLAARPISRGPGGDDPGGP